MLLQQLKEHIVKGSIDCTCKNQYHNSLFQLSENLDFEILSPGPTKVGPIVGKNLTQNNIFQPSENIYFENFFNEPTMMVPIADTKESHLAY